MKIDFKKTFKGPKGKNIDIKDGVNEDKTQKLRDLTLEDVVSPILVATTEMNQQAALDIKRRLFKLWMHLENSEDKVLEIPKDLLNIVFERVSDPKSSWGILIQMQVEEIFNGPETSEVKEEKKDA